MALSLRNLITIYFLFKCITGSVNGDLQNSGLTIVKDAVEGESINLPCYFDASSYKYDRNDEIYYYWHKSIGSSHSVVTINDKTFSDSYKLDNSPKDNKYDLMITSARYETDSGRFECNIIGKNGKIYNIFYNVTILLRPGPPEITPTLPEAKEGEPYKLTCSSKGGSPDPKIQWYKFNEPIDGEYIYGNSRDVPTKNVLTIMPTLNDNQAIFKCGVWNRAMKETEMTRSVTLSVNYVPRIKVGPSNPLNVLVGSDAFMTCAVSANPPAKKINWYKNDRILSHRANHTIIKVLASDSGTYSCIADNGIKNPDGSSGRGDLELSVQYAPVVKVGKEREVIVGDNVEVNCEVDANPKAHSIIWKRVSDSQIVASGNILNLKRVKAEDSDKYICIATNSLQISGQMNVLDRYGNASIFIRVRHRPGTTEILPNNPIAVYGKPFTLSCQANPSGWPAPEYKWWREGEIKQELSRSQNYSFISIHVRNEGKYYCQPSNSLGTGSVASVYLTVHEPPKIVLAMQPTSTKRKGDKGFNLVCRGRGKPRPNVIWYHNNEEINIDNGLNRIETSESIEDGNVYVLTSVLHFDALSRRDNVLTAADRGNYMCAFDNGVGSVAKAESFLRIEHSPVLMHNYNRVAYDIGENAVLQCKMSAYPEPKFEWFFNSKLLEIRDSYKYSTNVTENPKQSDIYVGTLTINDIRSSDYGYYTCRAWNSVTSDDEKTSITLAEKSAPGSPSKLEVLDISSDSVILRWEEGFNGGFGNTEFVVKYSNDGGHNWKNESCRNTNPCKILGLESRQRYRFKVLAVNPRGFSKYSEIIDETTKVNLKDMPIAYDAIFDRKTSCLQFRVEKTPLELLAKIEIREENSNVINDDNWQLLVSNQIIDSIETVCLKQTINKFSDMRVILCLKINESWCGYPHLVKIDAISTYLKESKVFTFEQLLLVIIIGGSLAFVVVLFLLCCCWKKRINESNKKDYDDSSDDNRPKVTTISPPYYSGHENKGLVNSNDEDNKTSPPPMYTSNPPLPQNYYLTGDDGNPSPNGSNETGHSDIWMMKNDGMNDPVDPQMAYHAAYGTTHSPIDPNAYQYSYYPTEDYQPIGDEYNMNMNMNMNMKNSLYSPYYDDGHNTYGSTHGSNMLGESVNDSHLLSPMDQSKINQIQFEDEVDYSGNRSGRVIREIIV